ncbi:hypothetical protein KI688_012344 [Linnemannia hyalina]|uniref:WD40 repeat-like protein n=1 Tax=Linnemannia hyalina TaxID=64524 RepID=A0A9P7XUF8_9FUNG|nr:hypothetical protein KI688_012344 [Linnemannia hyalina]
MRVNGILVQCLDHQRCQARECWEDQEYRHRQQRQQRQQRGATGTPLKSLHTQHQEDQTLRQWGLLKDIQDHTRGPILNHTLEPPQVPILGVPQAPILDHHQDHTLDLPQDPTLDLHQDRIQDLPQALTQEDVPSARWGTEGHLQEQERFTSFAPKKSITSKESSKESANEQEPIQELESSRSPGYLYGFIRALRGRYDSDSSNSEFSDSDSDYYRKNRRYKRRRFYSSSEDSSSDLDNGDSNDDSVAEVDTNGASTMRTDTSGFTPAERVNGPLVEMLSELKRLNNRYSELGEKQRRVQKKIRRITKDFESEIRELKREFPPGPDSQTGGSGKQAAQDTQSTQSGQPKDSAPRSTSKSTPRSTPQPSPPLAQNAESGAATGNRADPGASEPSSSRSRSFSRSRASTWNGGAVNTPADTNGQNAVPPPPSLIPASAGVTAKTEDDPDESLSLIKRNRRRTTSDEQMPNLSGAERGGGGARGERSAPNVQNYATAPTRSIGARRVFDRATYDLPIAKLQELSFISLGKSKAMGKIGGGGGRRPLVLNPFARGTPFENIAAVNSLDGLITLYDIDRQEKVMEIAPKLSRVIPFTETLAWVSEDTFVAVSHLKSGQTWEGVKENLARAKAAGTDVADNDPSRFSPPETQTNLISIFYGRDGELKNRIFTIQGFPHDRPIQTVTAVSRDDNTMGYVTAGRDKRLVHWKFTKLDGGNFVGGGMADVHNLHTNTILTTMYSHTSKRFYSGGLDGRYIVYDMEGRKTIVNDKLGRIVHIVQNPADPRLHAVVFSESTQYQYQLLDERVPGQKVLTLDHRCKTTVSKFSTPSWHTEGGLFCSGTDEKGFVNIWDVRWAGITLDDKSRPGKGCITADISEDGIMAARALVTTREAEKFDFGVGKTHPLLWGINQRLNSSAKGRRGGPSQVLEVGGNKVAQALFHPTRNVVMIQSFDGALSFTDYNMITKSVV